MIGQDMDKKKDLACPQCHQPLDSQVQYCGYCGADVSLAAIVVEPKDFPLVPLPAGVKLAPETLVPRLGDYLIEQKLLEPANLEAALEYQRRRDAAGQPVLLGQALVELGLIDRSTLDEAITRQILALHRKVQEANALLEQRVQERTAELHRALVRLTELNQLKSNFISNISHELRTPLTHIKGYLEILSDLSLGPLTPLQADAVEVLKRAENRLETLIEDLIQLSLAAKGELKVQLRLQPLQEFLEPVLAQAWTKAQLKGIRLISNIPQNLPLLLMDGQKIGWVLSQLLDNAIKFTPRDGEVRLSVNQAPGIVTIVVEDNGIGIPPERQAEIFEAFHQLDSSITRHYPGTGLGLAMVRRILDAHGSEIRVDSDVDRGSRFEFSLSVMNHNDG
jgi:signal transduction histidine kinase